MSFFPSAAAAQAAGFRPCLRCRPESAPALAAWRGTSNTVSRALSLIENGALDGSDVEQLAARLGIGERHLRRLFREHLGAAPAEVAATRRVLLAVQLIRETELPMAAVALAAGYGSVRRFNEVFRSLFQRPPHALRKEGAARGSAPAADGVVIRLPYRPPYDWMAMIAFLSARAIPGVETVSSTRYVRSIDMDGVQGIVAVEPAAESALCVTVHFPRLSKLPAIIDRVRRVFDLGADPGPIDAHLAADPALAPLVQARPGLRVPGAWDGFELAVRAIVGQQITVRAGVALAGELVRRYGELLVHPAGTREGLTHVFPGPERLASIQDERIGMPRRRAAALLSLARAMGREPDLLGAGANLDDCVNRLTSLAGVGQWTAQYIAMRELREPDAFPAGDVALQRAMGRLEGRTISGRELLARAERWRPWRGYAAQHLWSAAMPPGRPAASASSSG